MIGNPPRAVPVVTFSFGEGRRSLSARRLDPSLGGVALGVPQN